MEKENEFVPYEQDLALKELGFDEPCLAYYDGWNGESHLIITNQSGSFLSRLFRLFRKKEHDTYTQDYVEYLTGICTAPTFSQAFRWFRYKHNIYHVITIADLGKFESGSPDFQCAIYSKDPVLITNMDKYNTYEEAELTCLKKLIEIVKSKA